MDLRKTAEEIWQAAIAAAQPDAAVKRALEGRSVAGNVYLVAIGKAAWQMARAAVEVLGEKICDGIVITKYGHIPGPIPGLQLREAGHPVPDANSYRATQAAIDEVTGLTEDDLVLFLLSGGGSALFEKPLLAPGHTDPKSQWIILQYTRKLTILQGFLEKFSHRFLVFTASDAIRDAFFHFIQNKIEKTLVKSSFRC